MVRCIDCLGFVFSKVFPVIYLTDKNRPDFTKASIILKFSMKKYFEKVLYPMPLRNVSIHNCHGIYIIGFTSNHFFIK